MPWTVCSLDRPLPVRQELRQVCSPRLGLPKDRARASLILQASPSILTLPTWLQEDERPKMPPLGMVFSQKTHCVAFCPLGERLGLFSTAFPSLRCALPQIPSTSQPARRAAAKKKKKMSFNSIFRDAAEGDGCQAALPSIHLS